MFNSVELPCNLKKLNCVTIEYRELMEGRLTYEKILYSTNW